jgi:transcriptional regulator with XRE-family HTH domain
VILTGVTRGRKNPLHFGLPARLEAARFAADLALHTLALDAGLSYSAAYQVSAGGVPGIDTVERLANVLKVSPSFLAYGEAHEWTPAPAPRHEGVRGRLEQMRLARGMGRKPLGKASGTSDTAVRGIESGPSVPGVDTVERLAKALKCSPGWLAYGEGADPMAEPSGGGFTGKGILLGLLGWLLHIGKVTKA